MLHASGTPPPGRPGAGLRRGNDKPGGAGACSGTSPPTFCDNARAGPHDLKHTASSDRAPTAAELLRDAGRIDLGAQPNSAGPGVQRLLQQPSSSCSPRRQAKPTAPQHLPRLTTRTTIRPSLLLSSERKCAMMQTAARALRAPPGQRRRGTSTPKAHLPAAGCTVPMAMPEVGAALSLQAMTSCGTGDGAGWC